VNHKWLSPARTTRGTKLLVVVVFVLIAAWWTYMLKFRSANPQTEQQTAQQAPAPVLLASDPDGPNVTFPDEARCDNPEVNNFIVEFLNSLLADDYKNYRLKVTQQREPINQETFDEAYGRVKSITVKKIARVDDPRAAKELKLDNVSPPIYQVLAEVAFRGRQSLGQNQSDESMTREVMLTIFKEQNRWVSSH